MPLTALEELRLRIGDTSTDDQVLTDAQLEFLLDQYADNAASAAPEAAGCAYMALAVRAVDESAGAMSATLSARAEAYRQAALALGWVPGGKLALPFAGGMASSVETDATAGNSEEPHFTEALHEYTSDDYS